MCLFEPIPGNADGRFGTVGIDWAYHATVPQFA